ncbi:MAG: hemerythrin domain-containing protein [Terracidiphilus sp.]
MGIQIGAKPDSGFDDPIGMLVDCHRRIEHFLDILCLVAGRARGRGLTDEEREAVEASLQYFRAGGQRHNADEEASLFPRLRAATADQAAEATGGLESDHRRANELHARIEALYRKWIDADRLSAEEEEQLAATTGQLKSLYEEHIELEERVVFPRAAEALDAQVIAAIGEEFRARRQ